MKRIRSILRSPLRVSFGLARALGLLLVAATLVFFLSLRSTVARADDTMMQLSRHLVALAEAGVGRDERGLLVNGQTLGFRVFTVEQDMGVALDFYEDWCHGNSGDFATQGGNLALLNASPGPSPTTSSRSWRDLVVRSEDGDTGYVACLKHGMAGASSEELEKRIKGFMETGNLGELGTFHYAAVKEFESTTRVVATWTEEEFYPMTMFPLVGDAPGFEPTAFSRPPSGRRVLSAGEFGNDETLVIYADCQEDVPALTHYYQRDMSARGWQVMSDEATEEGRLLVAQRGGEMRALAISQEPGEATSVTVATTR